MHAAQPTGAICTSQAQLRSQNAISYSPPCGEGLEAHQELGACEEVEWSREASHCARDKGRW